MSAFSLYTISNALKKSEFNIFSGPYFCVFGMNTDRKLRRKLKKLINIYRRNPK